MPNGRGALDCSHCIFFKCWNVEWWEHDATAERGYCTTHAAEIPEVEGEHRLCGAFTATIAYTMELAAQDLSVAEKLSWFGVALDPDRLYRFQYNCPDRCEVILEFTN